MDVAQTGAPMRLKEAVPHPIHQPLGHDEPGQPLGIYRNPDFKNKGGPVKAHPVEFSA